MPNSEETVSKLDLPPKLRAEIAAEAPDNSMFDVCLGSASLYLHPPPEF